jgi:hypothetical protein
VSLINKAGKAAKFAVVTVPLGIIGWNQNRKTFMFLRGFWTRSVNPSCPECERGVLLCDTATPTNVKNAGKASTQLFPWVCSDCQYTLYEPRNPTAVRGAVALLKQQQAKAAFTELELAERELIAKRHRLSCRIFFVAAALTFANFIRLLIINAPLMFSVNWFSFAFMFWVFGMKRSYRAWQIANGHLFEKGAFAYWFKQGKWLI